jgi:methyltransferase (TIGR00027 family)
MRVKLQESRKLNEDNAPVTFTARLMAYYRALEVKHDHPLVVDPFAERLAGDLTSYFSKHRRYTEMDYPLVRASYLEKNLLTPWCNTQTKSQIVLLGAGLDTRAYRFKPLQTNIHTLFEIDFPSVIHYKEELLQTEKPLCDIIRVSADLSKFDWIADLIKGGFSNIPTFWILEGLIYYMEKDAVTTLLSTMSMISAGNSQLFVDTCIPGLAEAKVGPFSKHFKWGLDKKDIQPFFAATGWTVSWSYADDHDEGRDVGQKGLIFVQGVRAITV